MCAVICRVPAQVLFSLGQHRVGCDLGSGRGIRGHADDSDDPQGAVGLAVAATIQAMPMLTPRGSIDWAYPTQRREGGLRGQPVWVIAGCDQERTGSVDSYTSDGEQGRGHCLNQVGEVLVQAMKLSGLPHRM